MRRTAHIASVPHQPDLFADVADLEPAVPGLSRSGPLLDPHEQAEAVGLIEGLSLTPFRFGPWTGRRETISFGWHYDFERGGVSRADPMPDWLVRIRQVVAEAFSDPADMYEQALLIRYRPGAVIGWHRDRPQFGTVAGLSLGSPATMRLRRRRTSGFDRTSFALESGKAYRLDGEARHEWEHSIAALPETRWSISFRSIARPMAG